ncbi:tRNA (N6-threonylcarbamoyladenosine(37)-N6)-methyltransferase TrmO [Anderseniella sp. Alg231-50]|uniref:tRNA (N6-threonylcarbamoyladenosine(37)-N6)-methyltransferase TrmO n=1 Tax=Anderseniella sp. Alg231-50 TaxID=1922226 RepID=UPI000D553269
MTGSSVKCGPADIRDGEIRSQRDPAVETGDAHVVFIGRIRSPWRERSECPKNMRQAREKSAGDCSLEIDEAWRPGLAGLAAGDYLHILYWMHQARRDIVLQRPRHRETPAGVFSLRSPVRPNPVAMALVRITSVDPTAGIIGIDATDALDQTPLVDLKPYLPAIDHPSDR